MRRLSTHITLPCLISAEASCILDDVSTENEQCNDDWMNNIEKLLPGGSRIFKQWLPCILKQHNQLNALGPHQVLYLLSVTFSEWQAPRATPVTCPPSAMPSQWHALLATRHHHSLTQALQLTCPLRDIPSKWYVPSLWQTPRVTRSPSDTPSQPVVGTVPLIR